MTPWTRARATKRTHNRLKALRQKVDTAIVAMVADWDGRDRFISTTLKDINRTVETMAHHLAQDLDAALAEETERTEK